MMYKYLKTNKIPKQILTSYFGGRGDKWGNSVGKSSELKLESNSHN